MSLVIILICLEIFELWWQRADTLEGVLANTYYYYNKNIFLYFLMHPAFYFTLFVILYTEIFNLWLMAILVFKTMDIFFKITLMRGLFEDSIDINSDIRAILKEPLSPILFLTGLGVYPFLLFYGLG
jgi:hypothetical protein